MEKAIIHAQRGICRIEGCRVGLVAGVVTGKLNADDVEVLELDEPEQVSKESVATDVAATADNLQAAV